MHLPLSRAMDCKGFSLLRRSSFSGEMARKTGKESANREIGKSGARRGRWEGKTKETSQSSNFGYLTLIKLSRVINDIAIDLLIRDSFAKQLRL